MPLSAVAVRQATPRTKTYKLYDERGLYLEVTPKGAKRWRFKYRFGGKEKLLSMGLYPEVGLASARERREKARVLVAHGTDPSAVRKAQKVAGTNAFEALTREWHTKRMVPSVTPGYAAQVLRRLEGDIFPYIGTRPVGEITAPELLQTLRRVEARGAVETSHRLQQYCSQVFRYAVARGLAERDPSNDLRGALAKTGKPAHHASITDPRKVGGLLRAIDGYEGAFVTTCALRLAPLVFVRPGELRRAEWAEFDLKAAEWHIPAEKMKAGQKHIVPLSRQALAVLADLHPLTGRARYLFPSIRTPERCMSENTVNAALRRLGYSRDEMTGHGFRSMASTLLNEQGWNHDAIERQLAHGERNKVRVNSIIEGGWY